MKLLIAFFVISFLSISCNNNGTTSTSSTDSSTTAEKRALLSTDSSTYAANVDGADSTVTDSTVKLDPVENGLAWIKHYQAMVDRDESVSLKKIPNMIWLAGSLMRLRLQEANKMKLCFAVNPDDPNKKIVVLLQLRKPGQSAGEKPKFSYMELKKVKKTLDLEAFCPEPYPCNTYEPIEQ